MTPEARLHKMNGDASVDKDDRKLRRTVARACNGDSKAFGRLYDEHVDRVHAFVRTRVSDPRDAEDLTATVFMKAYEAIETYQSRGVPFSAWLFRIARNCIIDWHRREQRQPQTVPDDEALPLAAYEHGDIAKSLSDRERLREAICTLSEDQAAVIALRFVWDMSPGQAAEALGKTEGAVKALQHRAVRNLATALGEQGPDGQVLEQESTG